MKKISKIVLLLLIAAFAGFGQSISFADQPKPNLLPENQTAAPVTRDLGLFSRDQSPSIKASPASTGFCYLQATNVHMASSIPGSIAADALVTCSGTTIRISSITVTLYKNGFLPHYLVGQSLTGYASTSRALQYNNFKTPCSNQTISTYWSKAVAYGAYADGSETYATSLSPVQNLSCGTFF